MQFTKIYVKNLGTQNVEENAVTGKSLFQRMNDFINSWFWHEINEEEEVLYQPSILPYLIGPFLR